MAKLSRRAILAVAAACILASCQTTKPEPMASGSGASSATAATGSPSATVANGTQSATGAQSATGTQSATAASPTAATGQSSIEAQAPGFSPSSVTGETTIGFSLSFANAESVKAWKVEIASDTSVAKTYSGTGTKLPTSLVWDGKNDSGEPAPGGNYTAKLYVDYGGAFQAGTAKSASFLLDTVAASGSLKITPAFFAPQTPADKVTIEIDATPGLAAIKSWTMDIYDPGNNLFKTFHDTWGSVDTVSWDGKGSDGSMVLSAQDYPVVVKLQDEFGLVGVLKSAVSTDIIVEKVADGYMIPDSRLYFKPFTADYHDVPPAIAKQNMTRLDMLAARLKKFPDYRFEIIGHAVMIHWDNPTLGKIEEKDVLLPLSKARADAIKRALISRGLDGAKIETLGVGATDQIVPDSDLKDRWRNRRTEIFILK